MYQGGWRWPLNLGRLGGCLPSAESLAWESCPFSFQPPHLTKPHTLWALGIRKCLLQASVTAAARDPARLLSWLDLHGTAHSRPAMFRRHEAHDIYIDLKSRHLQEGRRWKQRRIFDTIFYIGHWRWGVSQRQHDVSSMVLRHSVETSNRCSCWGPQWANARGRVRKLMDLPLLWLPHRGLCLTLLIYWTDLYWAPTVCKAVLTAWVVQGAITDLVPTASVFCYHASSSCRILELRRRKGIIWIWTNMEN